MIATLFGKLVKIIALILKPFIYLIIGALCIALLALWVSAIVAIIFGQPYSEFFFGNHNLLSISLYGLGFIILSIPLLSTGFALWSLVRTRSLSTVRLKKKLGWIWVASVVIFISLISFFVRDFSGQGQTQQIFSLSELPEIIELDFQQHLTKNELFLVEAGEFTLAGNDFISNNIQSEFYPTDTSAEIQQINFSRGRDNLLAKNRADKINYEFDKNSSKWTIPRYFEIPHGEQWRAQKINLNFHLPIGQKVRILKSQRYNLPNVQYKGCPVEDGSFLLEMTEKGLQCVQSSK